MIAILSVYYSLNGFAFVCLLNRYTQQELNYFPLNTALYSPHKMLKSIFTDPTCVGVDDAEDDDGPDEGRDHISISVNVLWYFGIAK